MRKTRMPEIKYQQRKKSRGEEIHGFQYIYYLDDEEETDMINLEAENAFYFVMFDICKTDDDTAHRFYVKKWGSDEIITRTQRADDGLKSDTKIDRSNDFVWIGGAADRVRRKGDHENLQGVISDAKFFRKGCMTEEQVKDVAASYEICHSACPNACYGPLLEHCSISAVESYSLTDREYGETVSEKQTIDKDKALNGQLQANPPVFYS